jgi:pimeloyl-ACP methyl ester carboxylesterase
MTQAHNRSTTGLEDEYDRVANLTPVKIIWGKEDAWIPSDTAQILKNALKAKEVVVVEEAGHLIHYDQPSRLAVEVALWLGSNDKIGT